MQHDVHALLQTVTRTAGLRLGTTDSTALRTPHDSRSCRRLTMIGQQRVLTPPGTRAHGPGCSFASARPHKRRPTSRLHVVHPPQGAEPREALTGKQLQQWEATVARVGELGFEADKAEGIVEKSWGWKGQAFWRQSKVRIDSAHG